MLNAERFHHIGREYTMVKNVKKRRAWSPSRAQHRHLCGMLRLPVNTSKAKVREAFRDSLGMDKPTFGKASPGNPIDGLLGQDWPADDVIIAWAQA